MQIFREGKACFFLLSTGNLYHRQEGGRKKCSQTQSEVLEKQTSCRGGLAAFPSPSTGPAAVTNCNRNPESTRSYWHYEVPERALGLEAGNLKSDPLSDPLLLDYNEQFIPSPAISHFPLNLQFSPCYLNGLASEDFNELFCKMSTTISHPLVEGQGLD